MRRPTFFLSSTIFDFRDLRSALKFYLEQQGCQVLASEYNDFLKPLDSHSYEACLASINRADYFVLLIGARVGGWYDERNRISITQREYREAYDLQKAGKLKLITFVRSEVWNAKEDRRDLAKYLETSGLDSGVQRQIVHHPGKFAEDAEFIYSFINEVGRNRETKQAVRGEGAAPTGNWIHVFDGYRDIIDVINGSVFSLRPIEEQTLKRLLRRELCQYLAHCLPKATNGRLVHPKWMMDQFHSRHPIELKDRDHELFRVETKLFDRVCSLAMHLMAVQIHPVVLQEAVSRPTFLEFDLGRNTFVETPVYEALVTLQKEIRRFTEWNTAKVFGFVYKYSPRDRGPTGSTLEVETKDLVFLLVLLDRWTNIVELSLRLMKYMDGQAFQRPELRPDSPVHGMGELMEKEAASLGDVEQFISEF